MLLTNNSKAMTTSAYYINTIIDEYSGEITIPVILQDMWHWSITLRPIQSLTQSAALRKKKDY